MNVPLLLGGGVLRDASATRRAVEGVAYILHQGALPSVPRSVADPVLTNEINVGGTLSLLVAARDAEVRRAVFPASSSASGGAPRAAPGRRPPRPPPDDLRRRPPDPRLHLHRQRGAGEPSGVRGPEGRLRQSDQRRLRRTRLPAGDPGDPVRARRPTRCCPVRAIPARGGQALPGRSPRGEGAPPARA